MVPASPSLRVEVLSRAGGATAALLLAVGWDDETDESRALVLTEHGGLDWVSEDRIDAAKID